MFEYTKNGIGSSAFRSSKRQVHRQDTKWPLSNPETSLSPYPSYIHGHASARGLALETLSPSLLFLLVYSFQYRVYSLYNWFILSSISESVILSVGFILSFERHVVSLFLSSLVLSSYVFYHFIQSLVI